MLQANFMSAINAWIVIYAGKLRRRILPATMKVVIHTLKNSQKRLKNWRVAERHLLVAAPKQFMKMVICLIGKQIQLPLLIT